MSDLEDRIMKITQSEQQNEKQTKKVKKKNSLRVSGITLSISTFAL